MGALVQHGYHVSRAIADAFVAETGLHSLEVRHYPDRHTPGCPEWGVWNHAGSCWQFVELPVAHGPRAGLGGLQTLADRVDADGALARSSKIAFRNLLIRMAEIDGSIEPGCKADADHYNELWDAILDEIAGELV